MKIALLGYMGSGKSLIGKDISNELGLTFIDLDEEIEKEMNDSISNIVNSRGELLFRRKEREVLSRVLELDNFVLATGGGTPCYYDNMNLLNEHCDTFYLNPSNKVLVERLKKDRENRPLIAHVDDDNLVEFIAKHVFERRAFYEKSKYTLLGPDFKNEILRVYGK